MPTGKYIVKEKMQWASEKRYKLLKEIWGKMDDKVSNNDDHFMRLLKFRKFTNTGRFFSQYTPVLIEAGSSSYADKP